MATSAEIYEILRRDVVSGKYEPMHCFDPRQLAAEYYTSVAPIREALLKLSERGLLRRERNRGFFVEKISGSSAIFYLEQLKSSYLYGLKRCTPINVNVEIHNGYLEKYRISNLNEYIEGHIYITSIIFSDQEKEFIRSIWDRIWIYMNIYLNDRNNVDYLCVGLRTFSELFAANRVEDSAEVATELFDNIIETLTGILARVRV